MGTCSGPCFLPRQSLLLPSRGIRPFPRPFKQRIALAHDHCFPPGLHFSQVAEIVGFKARLQRELQSSGLSHPPASASPAAPPCPSLESFGWNQMPIGQSSCCLALHSIQTIKPGASLGPSDLLRAAGQSPAKCCLFSCCGCGRLGLRPRE